jgi:hypothetical protein
MVDLIDFLFGQQSIKIMTEKSKCEKCDRKFDKKMEKITTVVKIDFMSSW